ncbi:MAG: hypothetical protein JWQ89_2419, partial [Devosia sp.]|nr:hypothetical protein [Devosia sp.]
RQHLRVVKQVLQAVQFEREVSPELGLLLLWFGCGSGAAVAQFNGYLL